MKFRLNQILTFPRYISGMGDQLVFDRLRLLLRDAPTRVIDDERIVVLSDLHLGNGGGKDDFLRNSGLVSEVLARRYLPKGYTLVLNGDIEDFQKFTPSAVKRAWKEFYGLLREFRRKERLVRIFGNHDELLSLMPGSADPPAVEAVRFLYRGSSLFVFHGHQASLAMLRFNTQIGRLIRFLVRPLGIMNDSVARDNRKKFTTERRIYEFSNAEKIISVVGHTHRPLFESQSKGDTLRFRIEKLCRRYPLARGPARKRIAREIVLLKQEFRRLLEKHGDGGFLGGIYENRLSIPSIFNSGCATGKRGITCIEIAKGRIRLVHWFRREEERHPDGTGHEAAEELGKTGIFRLVIKEESLDYIFTRIKLLT